MTIDEKGIIFVLNSPAKLIAVNYYWGEQLFTMKIISQVCEVPNKVDTN